MNTRPVYTPGSRKGMGGRRPYVEGMDVNRIKARMIELRMTQQELSELLGMEQAYISRMACGRFKPRESTKARIAKALGVSVPYLFDMTEAA